MRRSLLLLAVLGLLLGLCRGDAPYAPDASYASYGSYAVFQVFKVHEVFVLFLPLAFGFLANRFQLLVEVVFEGLLVL